MKYKIQVVTEESALGCLFVGDPIECASAIKTDRETFIKVKDILGIKSGVDAIVVINMGHADTCKFP